MKLGWITSMVVVRVVNDFHSCIHSEISAFGTILCLPQRKTIKKAIIIDFCSKIPLLEIKMFKRVRKYFISYFDQIVHYISKFQMNILKIDNSRVKISFHFTACCNLLVHVKIAIADAKSSTTPAQINQIPRNF